MMLVSTPTKHCIQPRSPSCDSSMPQYYSRNRNCTPPRFASESSPFGSPVLTPSPLRQRPLFPTTAGSMQDSDDLFVQPSGHPASPNPLAPSPQPIAADDDEGSIFLSSGPSPFAAAFISQPLLTPARQSHRPLNRTALGLRNLNAGLSSTELLPSTSLDSGSRIGLGTKRKSTTHNTPLRHHNLTPLKVALSASDDRDKSAFLFDRLAPLPTPKTNARTPQTKAETDLYLRRQTATLTRLRISDRGDSGDEFNDDANDSGCEIDEDEANTLFLSNARMKNKVPSLGKSAGRVLSSKSKSKEEVAEAISPGGHVTKRRARSRPVSTELKQSVRSPKSPSRVLTTGSNATRPKIRSTVSFPSTHTRSPSSSSTSEAGSPVRRRRTNAVAAHMSPPSKLPEPPLPPRPPLSRLESVSSATLFFGPPIPQNPAPASIRSRTNTLISTTSPDLAVKASTKGKTKRHSYTGLDDLRAWNTIQARLPSPVSSPDNASFVNTDIDDDMDFDDYPPNSSLVLNVMANTPSPLTKTTLQTKYKPRDSGVVVSDDNGGIAFANTKSLEGGHFLFPIAQSSTSVSSNFSDNDEGLVTPGVAPDSGSCWSDTNIFIRGTDDNGRTSHGSLEGGVDVDAFIMKTLASAANGPHEVMKKVPGTPVKRSRTTFLAGDRPWQSAVASKVGPRLDFNEKKAPRKSLPAVFPVIPRHGDQSIDSSDSEGEQDSPSSRKEPKYGNLGLGRPSATDVPLALTRTRWLMRRSSSGAFSSGSESASLSTTPTRNKATDWQLPKPRIPAMFSQAPQLSFKPTSARSASGSSNSSTVTISPTDRSRHLAISGSRCTVPRARSATRRSSEFTAEEQSGRFGREFVELAEVGCGEFGKVIKVRRKTGDDSEVCAIKKSKRFEGARHRLRLREEVDILKHLSQTALDCGFNGRHPNVLAYIDSWEEDEQLFIQTELCESGNLARFLWEYGRVFPRLDEARVWKIIADLSNGLRFIHDAGIIHLDLKPSNVFLTKEGRFKIGDFGMASAWPRPSTEDGSGLGGGSLERGAFEREGDKLYLAPEVLQGRYGKEVDVFSLGMTILETASNIVVPDQGEAWHRLRREDFSQVDLEEESGELLGLIKQMMRVDPASRINARGICDHPVVARARGAMERMMGDARRDGKPEFVGSPLASVPPGFLEEILGRGRDGGWEMDMSA